MPKRKESEIVYEYNGVTFSTVELTLGEVNDGSILLGPRLNI